MRTETRVRTAAEMGMMDVEATECQEPPKLQGIRKDPPLGPSEGVWASRLQPPEV